MFADPDEVFRGNLVFAAPHMDDEVLACGGTIARLREKGRMHVLFATDGSRSPRPSLRWMGAPPEGLAEVRRGEAVAALAVLGVPEENLHFLGFPDGALRRDVPVLAASLAGLIERLQPDHLFIPFRYDRHPDHLALRRAALEAVRRLDGRIGVVEYFVYYRWRLVPGGDVRAFIRPEQLIEVDIRQQSDQKRRALKCYRSQTTCCFWWQDRPILPPERVAEVSRAPELFLRHEAACAGAAVFSRLRHWIPLVHWVEPPLKKGKDRIQAIARYVMQHYGRSA